MLPLLLSASLLAPAADPAKYARPDLLVEVADLKDGKFVVLDVRSAAKYGAQHVPGAASAPVGVWAKAIDDGKADAAFWKAALAALGVTPKSTVVVYSSDWREAARAWWALKLAGVPDVRVLNGGWRAYLDAKLPTSTEPTTPKAADPAEWKPEPRLAVLADVVKLADGKAACIVDARTATEFERGRVPGAKPLDWAELVDDKTQKVKPAADLAKLFEGAKIDLAKPCVTYCQGGGRAAVMAFALELMGAKDVRNYHKSWGEYGSDKDAPKEKKEK
jgi:thiosulfate/3-mercaptopyruvate sulfurtransferase